MRECVELLYSVILQGAKEDRWIWRFHSSNRYTVRQRLSYHILSDAIGHDLNYNGHRNFIHILWLKVVPLKVYLFVWCSLFNQVSTRENVVHQQCIGGCGYNEDMDHLFVTCAFTKIFGL